MDLNGIQLPYPLWTDAQTHDQASRFSPAHRPILAEPGAAVAAIASPTSLDGIEVGTPSGAAMADETAEEAGQETHVDLARRMRVRE